jgi:hypothetical protein
LSEAKHNLHLFESSEEISIFYCKTDICIHLEIDREKNGLKKSGNIENVYERRLKLQVNLHTILEIGI